MKAQFLIQLDTLLQVTGITSGRAAALLPAGLGLLGVIIGWIAFRRSRRQVSNDRLLAISGILLSITDLILSVLHLIRTSNSSFGTGSGKLGAIVAVVLGLIGIILGGMTIARSKASDPSSHK